MWFQRAAMFDNVASEACNEYRSAPGAAADIKIVDGSALMPEEGPSGTMADIESQRMQQSVYVVRGGDTLTGIAKL